MIKKFLGFALGLVVGMTTTVAIANESSENEVDLVAEITNIVSFLNDRVCPAIFVLNERVTALEKMQSDSMRDSSK